MSAMPALATPAQGSHTVRSLAIVETKRLARHPVFLLGALATAVLVPMSGGVSDDYYNATITAGFFLGLFSMIAMFRLTRSMDRAQAALDPTPAAQRERTLALCLAGLLPALLSIPAFLATYALSEASAPWALGGFDTGERLAIFFGNIVMAGIGGPLLGVAAGRWLRFPGAVVALTVGVLFWVLLGEGLGTGQHDATWSAVLRMMTPWTQFTSVESDLNQLEVWRGSPYFYLGWLACLCVLAVLGALLKGAEADARRTLLRTGFAVGLVGLVFVTLSVVLGPDVALLHTPTGVAPY